MTVPDNLTERLADFVAATRLEDLPASARERARIVLANTVASALMGSRSAEVPLIEQRRPHPARGRSGGPGT